MTAFYDAYEIIGTAYRQADSFAACFTASVYGYQKVVASAFYVECDFPVVANDNRAYVQAVSTSTELPRTERPDS
jgi:hypothetical protein